MCLSNQFHRGSEVHTETVCSWHLDDVSRSRTSAKNTSPSLTHIASDLRMAEKWLAMQLCDSFFGSQESYWIWTWQFVCLLVCLKCIILSQKKSCNGFIQNLQMKYIRNKIDNRVDKNQRLELPWWLTVALKGNCISLGGNLLLVKEVLGWFFGVHSSLHGAEKVSKMSH